MNTQTLTEFLAAKGVRNDLRVKRALAAALGLPMDKGTHEQESALLRALQAGEMASITSAKESFKVEVAFHEELNAEFANQEDANTYRDKQNNESRVCRVSKVITISQVL